MSPTPEITPSEPSALGTWDEVLVPSTWSRPTCEFCGRRVSSRAHQMAVGEWLRWACNAECARKADALSETIARDLRGAA